jgi:hypothetical protein
MSAGAASADPIYTVVDFSFSGPVTDANGAIGTASGKLVFLHSGTDVPAEATITVTGVPGFTSSQGDFSLLFNRWDISPNGQLLGGFLESSTSDGAGGYGEDFSLSDGGPAGNGFAYYNPDGYVERFAGDTTFTYETPVPEPWSIAVFGAGLLCLMLVRRTRSRFS